LASGGAVLEIDFFPREIFRAAAVWGRGKGCPFPTKEDAFVLNCVAKKLKIAVQKEGAI
jgi:hypothetical protein